MPFVAAAVTPSGPPETVTCLLLSASIQGTFHLNDIFNFIMMLHVEYFKDLITHSHKIIARPIPVMS